MKKCNFCFCMLLACLISIGQTVTYTTRPIDLQLYPRNTATNTAVVPISGSIAGSGATQIKIKLLRNGIPVSETTPQPATSGSTFDFDVEIAAELAQYRFVRSLETAPGIWTDVDIADNVVSGDAIIIQGQSNAAASQDFSEETLSATYTNAASPYIRVLGSATETLTTPAAVQNLQWFVGDGNATTEQNGNTGQWGYVMANLVIQETGIPIAIFNGAKGGAFIAFFPRNDANPGSLSTNYGRLYSRILKAGLQNNIKAIFWYQGESDAVRADETLASYKQKLNDLITDWKTDFPTTGQRFYIAQIRRGCNQPAGLTNNVKEALRQVALENSADTRIYGTGTLDQIQGTVGVDFCHFGFDGGYEKVGIDYSRLLLADVYGEPLSDNSLSPFVTTIQKTAPTQVTLTFANAAPLTVTPGALSNFIFVGAASQPTITSHSFVGNTMILNLSTYPAGTTGLSYRENHVGATQPDIVTTTNNLALVNFINIAILSGTFPVKLVSFAGVWKQANENSLSWTVTDESQMSGYEIQHSTDGSNFQKISFETANNSSAQQQYTYVHQGVSAPVNYYRLKMLDLNGTFTYSAIVSISSRASIKAFAVSVNPNPVVNDAHIYIESNTSGRTEIDVINQLGQRVIRFSRDIQVGLNTITVAKTDLSGKGIYFVRVKKGKIVETSKFVITN